MDLKELLLKDLSARLPYGVIVNIEYSKEHGSSYRLRVCSEGDLKLNTDLLGLFIQEEIYLKPYLRPMSSMTEDEVIELEDLFQKIDAPCWIDPEYGCVNFVGGNDFIDTEIAEVYTDWLNKKMFDWRGLISMNFALEAPKGMY